MKHVLFVDDEPNVLAGLQRALRSLRGEWTMGFVDGGESALAYLAEHSVDVIVTDMRMPGIDGVQLLREVMARYPSMVRIALSGQSDHETLLKVAGLAHQYLSKPCPPDVIAGTLKRAMTLRDRVEESAVKGLVARMSSIPSLPMNYQEVMRELKSPEPSLKTIGEIIARDAAMTAKVLQIVNSAFFGLAREVTSPAQAVTLLGLETVQGLVLSVGVFSQFEGEQAMVFSLDDLISHSLHVAGDARRIAAMQTKDEVLRSEAYVAGLLHDIGKLILAINFPNPYGQAVAAAQDWGLPLAEVERETFGADHADVGGYVLTLWGLPTPLVEAVAFHHEPAKCLATGFTPLTAVHVANALSPHDGAALTVPSGGKVDESYLAAIGLSDQLVRWQELLAQTNPLELAHD